MSTYLERIRARTRRQIAKRAKRLGQAPTASAPTLEPVLLDAEPDPVANLEGEQHDDAAGDVQSEGADVDATAINAELDATATTEQPKDTATELEQHESEPARSASPSVIRLEFAKSSNVRAAELGADGIVAVEFRDGAIYRYANFTLDLMAEWEAAKSAGSWFHNNVRTKPDRHPVIDDGQE